MKESYCKPWKKENSTEYSRINSIYIYIYTRGKKIPTYSNMSSETKSTVFDAKFDIGLKRLGVLMKGWKDSRGGYIVCFSSFCSRFLIRYFNDFSSFGTWRYNLEYKGSD